jgi:hypothetical protein
LGKLAPDLYGKVQMAIRKRLGTVPDVFAFLSVTPSSVELKIGSQRPALPSGESEVSTLFWRALTLAAASIGNIRVRTCPARLPPGAEGGFEVVRGGPDIYLVECLSDPMGWSLAFETAEKIFRRCETPPGTGRARGVFPLFHLPSLDEEGERQQALEGLRRLESLMKQGILFPSIVLDRVNRNGYPLERWEDLVELLSDFLVLGSASEAALDIWRTFPQVADLHSLHDDEEGGLRGISSLGLSRVSFNREELGGQLGRLYLRDLKRCFSGTFAGGAGAQPLDDGRVLVDALVADRSWSTEGSSGELEEGSQSVEAKIIEWARKGNPDPSPSLASWAFALDSLQKAIFERLGDVSQRIENARQESEALSLESPLKETWIARVSLLLPSPLAYFPAVIAGALAGTLLGLIFHPVPLAGYLAGGALGGTAGLLLGYWIRRMWKRETFTLGEFPKSAFTDGFPLPRTLEHHLRRRKKSRGYSGVSLQLWGELRNQLDASAQDRLDEQKAKLEEELCSSREEEARLIFLDRHVSTLRECVEEWRERLSEVEIWEPGRGFSGDVFPADGPRKIYDWLQGREAAEKDAASLLPRIVPSSDPTSLLKELEELSSSWGEEKAGPLELAQVFAILDDRPDTLLERMSEASAPLWPRPGDRDEILRCVGDDFKWLSKPGDLRHSVRDETICLRILGGIKSAELMRS